MSSGCTCRKKHLHGASRSLVRRIGSSLPINTGRRLYIQLPSVESPLSEHDRFRYEATGQMYVSSQGLTLASHMKDTDSAGAYTLESISEEGVGGYGDVFFDEEAGAVFLEGEGDSMFTEQRYRSNSQGSITSDEQKQDALHKITALEGELARLKAQIAVYALSETEGLSVPAAPPPPPPPPPMSQPAPVSGDVRDAFQATPHPASGKPSQQDLQTPARPSMSEMLKDIGSVKLKTIDAMRSPGGTLLRPKHHNLDAVNTDPGAIIAQALRRKFAHQVFQDSPDKENLNRSDVSMSGFDSPNVKLFN